MWIVTGKDGDRFWSAEADSYKDAVNIGADLIEDAPNALVTLEKVG